MARYFVEFKGHWPLYLNAPSGWIAAIAARMERPRGAEVKRVWRIFADGSQRILKERSWK